MGIYTDALANTKSVDAVKPREGIHRAVSKEIETLRDRVDLSLSSAGAATNAVRTIPTDTVDHTGGNFTLTLRLVDATGRVFTITTGTIAHNATAATITSAINTAVTTAAFPGWTNGDISVALTTNLQAGAATLTFTGASVLGKGHGNVTMTDSRTGGTSPSPTVVQTTWGNAAREALQILFETGTLVGTVPAAGASSFSFVLGQRAMGRILSPAAIRVLARDAAIAEFNSGLQDAILVATGL
jgi:hypothetical protein